MDFQSKLLILLAIVVLCVIAGAFTFIYYWAEKQLREKREILNDVYEKDKKRIFNEPIDNVISEANKRSRDPKDL